MNGNNVAKIFINVNRIYSAYASFEEGYIEPIDPQMTGQFFLRRPQYRSGMWKSWPQSAATVDQHNYVSMRRRVNNVEEYPGSVRCNPGAGNHVYGVSPNVGSEYWYWYAGTGGAKCSWLFAPVTVEDTAGVLAYSSGWTASSGWPRATNNTVKFTQAANADVTLTNWPASTSITRIYTMASNRGNQTVTVEGAQQAQASDNATTTRWQVAKTWPVGDGAATIKVRRDSGYIDADAFVSDIPRNPIGPIYDDRHYNIKYIGSWKNNIGFTGPYSTTISFSNIAEDAATFTFEGNKIRYYYTRASNRGIAAVTIDGVHYANIDMCSPTTVWGGSDIFPSSGSLPAGVHTIHISNTGSTSCGAGNTYIDIDRFRIEN